MLDGLLRRAADDQGRARLVDQDVVDLVHDGVVPATALHLVLDAHRHVVAQVIEPEFVVGPVENVGPVSILALHRVKVLERSAAGFDQFRIKYVGGIVL